MIEYQAYDYVEKHIHLPHNSDYVFFLFNTLIIRAFVTAVCVYPHFHTMFVKGFCEIFSKKFSTPQ